MEFLATAKRSDIKYNGREVVSSKIKGQDHPSATMARFNCLTNPFMEWKNRHRKTYVSAEHEIERMLVWMKNGIKIR